MAVIFEPSELELEIIDLESRGILRRIGCLNFFEKIDGYNIEVTKTFSLYFDGEQK